MPQLQMLHKKGLFGNMHEPKLYGKITRVVYGKTITLVYYKGVWRFTLKNKRCFKRFFIAMPWKNHFWLHKEPIIQRSSRPFLFIIWRTIFSHFSLKPIGSSKVKGSLWNHVDNNKGSSTASWSTFVFKSVVHVTSNLLLWNTNDIET